MSEPTRGPRAVDPSELHEALMRRAERRREAPVQPLDAGGPRLTDAQIEVWLQHMLEPRSSALSTLRAWRITGALDLAALERATQALAARHIALRIRVNVVDGVPRPVYADDVKLVPEPEFPPSTDPDPEAWLARRLSILAEARIGIEEGKPIILRLYCLGPDQHVFAIGLNHIIGDEQSLVTIWHDLLSFYAAETGHGVPPPPLSQSYGAVVAATCRRPVARPVVARHEAGGHPDRLPWPLPRAPRGGGTRNLAPAFVEPFRLDQAMVAALHHAARAQGVTLFSLLAAAYQVLLARYCGVTEVSVGVPYSLRKTASHDEHVGMFVDHAGIGADLATSRPVARIAQDFQRKLGDIRQGNVANLRDSFSATIVRFRPVKAPVPLPGLKVDYQPFPTRSLPVDLHLAISDVSTGMALELRGRKAVFDRKLLGLLVRSFTEILRQVAVDPCIGSAEVRLMPDTDRSACALAAVAPAPPDAISDIPTRFGQIVAAYPDASALRSGDHVVTYRDLAAQAQGMGQWMTDDLGLKPGDPVALMLPRGAPMIVATLGAMLAGLVVVPVDPRYPDAHLAAMLETARCQAVLCDGPELCARIDALSGPVAGRVKGHLLPGSEVRADVMAQPAGGCERPAYIVFTSGSTGRPKGVITPHSALTRLARCAFPQRPRPGVRIVQLASPGFDGAFIEIWGALLNGAELVCPEGDISDMASIAALLRDQAVDGAFLTTGIFNLLVDEAPEAFASMAWLLVGGEAMSRSHAERCLAEFPELVLCNVYGPTENGALTTVQRVWRGMNKGEESFPIGTPFAGNAAFVLDRNGFAQPFGFAGELWVGGPGLALGYMGQAALTADKFRSFDPELLGLPAGPPLRLYATGDRARWRPDGDGIDYLGRLDTQVKLNGYQIEPGELERMITAQPNVRNSAVTVAFDGPGGAVSGVSAVFETLEPARDPQRAEDDLRQVLSRQLPRFLMPTRFVHVQALPLTANGKVDRKALAAIVGSRAVATGDMAQINPRLLAIWRELLPGPITTPDADFFRSGGHSLLAMRMLAQVERSFGVPVEVATFLRDSRLVALNASLRTQDADPAKGATHPNIRLLRAGQPGQRPLFCVMGVMGQVTWANAMVETLPKDGRPIYGVVLDPNLAIEALPATVAELSNQLLDAILSVTGAAKDDTIDLAGYSMGGFLAYTIGAALEARGIVPGRVILIDPNTNLAPDLFLERGIDDEGLSGGIKALRLGHRLRQVAFPIDFVFCERGFPRPRGQDPEEWAILTTAGVDVHVMDTFHLSVIHMPWAALLAGKVSDILAGKAQPAQRLVMPWAPQVIEQVQDAADSIAAGRFGDAERLYARIARNGSNGAVPEFIRILRIAIAGKQRSATALWRQVLAATMRKTPPTALEWEALARAATRCGKPALAAWLLRRGFARSVRQGRVDLGYVLVRHHLARGNVVAAQRVADHLATLPGGTLDAHMACAAIASALGKPGDCYRHLTTAMTRSDVGPPYFIEALKDLLGESDRTFALALTDAALELYRGDPIFRRRRSALETVKPTAITPD